MHKLETEVNKLIGDILSDYEKGRDIDNIHTFDHPKKEVIIEIVDKLRNIIFPGYFKNGTYRIYTVRNNMTMLLEDVLYNLIRQISIVLRYVPEFENADERDISEEAERLALKFVKPFRRSVNMLIPTFRRHLTAILPHSTRTR